MPNLLNAPFRGDMQKPPSSEREEDKRAAYNEQIAGYLLKPKADERFLEIIQFLDSYQRMVVMPW
jgi:hypothetical protein